VVAELLLMSMPQLQACCLVSRRQGVDRWCLHFAGRRFVAASGAAQQVCANPRQTVTPKTSAAVIKASSKRHTLTEYFLW
jgi:hypothetical protein